MRRRKFDPATRIERRSCVASLRRIVTAALILGSTTQRPPKTAVDCLYRLVRTSRVDAMHYGRRFSLPIDPWPQASLGERTAVGMVLTFLLLVPACAAGVVLLVTAMLVAHVDRSYDLGASLRALIERRLGFRSSRKDRIVWKA
jgi:hypothetical protein